MGHIADSSVFAARHSRCHAGGQCSGIPQRNHARNPRLQHGCRIHGCPGFRRGGTHVSRRHEDHASRRRPLTAGQPTTLGLLRWAMPLHARIDATPTTAPTACWGRTHRRPSCRCHRFFRVRWAQQSKSLAQPYTECRLIASPQGAAPPAPQQQDPCCTRRCPPGRRQCPSAVSSGLRRRAERYPGTHTRHIHSRACNHTPLAWLTRQLCAASAPGRPSTSWVDVQAGMSRPGLFACRGKCRFLISSAAKRSCRGQPSTLGRGRALQSPQQLSFPRRAAAQGGIKGCKGHIPSAATGPPCKFRQHIHLYAANEPACGMATPAANTGRTTCLGPCRSQSQGRAHHIQSSTGTSVTRGIHIH